MGDPGGRGIGLRVAAWVCTCAGAFWGTFWAGQPALRAQEAVIARPPSDEGAVRRDLLGRTLADGSSGALILFLARYPDGPDAGTVRAALAARRQPDPAPVGGPDGDIVAAFDRARLDGPATLDAFAARYPNHPLAAEARRWSRWLRAGKDAPPESRGTP